ncbi:MAG: orotidine 5'-phosphate decarboxylase [Rickettsiales bacterium]|jgi:orotidine-5'-phosphate decarboxylase|nr:orotidine 5'-phosphate decarboxylase [Rickettsiales bacterium]
MRGFELVTEQVEKKNSRVIIGMDEGWAELPTGEILRRVRQGRDYAVGVKPNGGFWPDEKLGEVSRKIRAEMPEMVIIHDAKRGDIGNTQKGWAKKDQELINPHISTINTYMGYNDTTGPFLERGIDAFALAATSNPGTDFQNMFSGGLRNYQQMYLLGRAYNPNDIGYVVGSTKGGAMIDIRAIELEHGLSQAWILAPGLGSSGQKGEPEAIVPFGGANTLYPLSRQFAVENPGAEIKLWRDKINETAARGYSIKSYSELFIENMIESGIFRVAESVDKEQWFTLKNGTKSPIYWDVRNIQWYPALRRQAAYLMAKKIAESGVHYDYIVPVLMGALGLGFPIADLLDAPVLTLRQSAKDHGDKLEYVGRPEKGMTGIIVEDVITSGISSGDTVNKLRGIGQNVSNVAALIDREQGGEKNLKDLNEVNLLCGFVQSDVIGMALGDNPMKDVVMNYIKETTKQK